MNELNEMKKAFATFIDAIEKLAIEQTKYKQALEEVREIAKLVCKDLCNYCDWQNTDSCEPNEYTCGVFTKIQHKINEVLKDEKAK